jgi:hypothetical protein
MTGITMLTIFNCQPEVFPINQYDLTEALQCSMSKTGSSFQHILRYIYPDVYQKDIKLKTHVAMPLSSSTAVNEILEYTVVAANELQEVAGLTQIVSTCLERFSQN